MGEQQSTSRRGVLLAGVAVVFAATTFAAAFYLFDGAALIQDLFASGNTVQTPSSPPATPATQTDRLALPTGMPEEFALRMWQEQIDSQEMITRLVNGDITALTIRSVDAGDDEATLTVSARLADQTNVPGVIGMRRFEDQWYVAFATAKRNGRIERPSGKLPARSDVDLELLNTIFEQQGMSQPVIGEYLEGIVSRITMDEIRPGPNTTTIGVTMHEDHGLGFAQIVAIQREIGGKPHWFLARFTKTGHDPPEL